MQSKKLTLIEAVTKALTGYIFSVLGQMLVYEYKGLILNIRECMLIAFLFFLFSIGKNFGIRRFFEKFGKKIMKYLKLRKRKKIKKT